MADEDITLYDGIEEQPRAYQTEADAASGDGGAIYTEAVDNRVELAQKLDEMPKHTRRGVIKVMQYKILDEVLNALANLKKTSEREWRSVINKMQAISGINIGDDKSKFDFNGLLKKLIPMVALIAGMLLALRESEREESEVSKPEDNKDSSTLNAEKAAVENEIKFELEKAKSVILQYCSENKNGYSLNRNG